MRRNEIDRQRSQRFIEEEQDRYSYGRPGYQWVDGLWVKDDEARDPMGVPASVLELNPDIGKEAA
jgi:hypothetical protein